MRASELPSPAPRGHFLRQFGQSDRETIEAAEIDASVAQVLTLMNGSMLENLTDKNTVLMKNIAAAEGDEAKQDAIFLTLLGRTPAEHEREILKQQFAKHGGEKATRNVIWALLNTREFAFVQ
jgi:hypothetical protein